MKSEHHIPYFKTINVLFDGSVSKLINKSFIAEHMMIDRDIMIEMITKIENNKNIKGSIFFEKILFAIDKDEISGSGFSEFETYGNYVLKYHPRKYSFRELRTLRQGATFIDKSDLNNDVLNWIAKDYDTISFESWSKVSKCKIFRHFLKSIIKTKILSFIRYCKIVNILH
jgi:hypothetical protein